MYRTNHFNPCDFSFTDFGYTQSEVCEIYTCPDTGFCIVFFHFLQEDIQQCVVLVTVRNFKMKQTIDLIHFLRRAEDGLLCFIECSEKELSCGK